jgi:hypothetical protein
MLTTEAQGTQRIEFLLRQEMPPKQKALVPRTQDANQNLFAPRKFYPVASATG